MASGQTLDRFVRAHNEPPPTDFASIGTRNNHPILLFDDTTDEEAVFTSVLPSNYGGGGITAYLHVSMETAVANDVVFQGTFERIGEVLDLDGDNFAAFQSSGAITVPGNSGDVVIIPITFTDGVQIGNLAIGELYRFKVRRDADNTSAVDDAVDDAELSAVEIRET